MSVYVQLHTTIRKRDIWWQFWHEHHYEIVPIEGVPRLPWAPGREVNYPPFPTGTTVTHISIWDEPEDGWCIFGPHLPMDYPVGVPRGHTFDLTDLNITIGEC